MLVFGCTVWVEMMIKNLKSVWLILISAAIMTYVTPTHAEWFFKNKVLSEKILGRWYSEINRDDEGMVSKFIGVTEYFRNGSVNYEGQIISYAKDEPEVSYYCGHNATYTWQIKKEYLYQTMRDAKVFPNYVKQKGDELSNPQDIQTLLEFCAEIQRFYRDENPKGKTEEYRLIQINDESLIYSYKDDNGKPVIETEARTERGFGSYRR